MSKEPRLRILSESEHVKGSAALLKSGGQYISHIFWSLWKEISSKNSVLVVSEIMKLFLNILTPNDKYSIWVKASV